MCVFTLVSSCALARLSTAMAKNTLSKVSVHRRVKELHINTSLVYEKTVQKVNQHAMLCVWIQLPKSVRTMKKTEKTMPVLTPPWDSIPSYMTMFQSSPVRIWVTKKGPSSQSHGQHTQSLHTVWWAHLITWNTVIIAAGKVSKFVGGVPDSKLNLKRQNCSYIIVIYGTKWAWSVAGDSKKKIIIKINKWI